MSLTTEEWREQKREEEREQLLRFDGLTAYAIRLGAYAVEARRRAEGVARLPASDATALLVQAEDMERAARMADWYAARLDRLHLLEDPVRTVRKSVRGAA